MSLLHPGLVALCVSALTLLASTASAQQPVRSSPVPPPTAAVSQEPPSIEELVRQGNLGMGGTLNFNYTSNTNRVFESGQDATNSTMFVLINPEFGYFMSDRLQLSINVGALIRRLQREGQDANFNNDWVLGAGLKYHIPLTERFSFIPGAGAAFYFGSSSRQITIPNPESPQMNITIDEPTSTFGGNVNGQLAFGYLVGERTELLTGVNFNYLYGRESVRDQSLRVSTFSTSLTLGLFYYF